MKQCPVCKRELPDTAFGTASDKKDGLQWQCKECKNQYFKDNKQRSYDMNNCLAKKLTANSMLYVLQYLKDHGCIDCGEKDPRILEFDHVRGTKVKAISKMVQDNNSLSMIDEEIAKCEVRCANCHRLKTVLELGHYSYIDFDTMTIIPETIPKLERLPGKPKINWPPTKNLIASSEALGYATIGRNLGVTGAAVKKRIQSHPDD